MLFCFFALIPDVFMLQSKTSSKPAKMEVSSVIYDVRATDQRATHHKCIPKHSGKSIVVQSETFCFIPIASVSFKILQFQAWKKGRAASRFSQASRWETWNNAAQVVFGGCV